MFALRSLVAAALVASASAFSAAPRLAASTKLALSKATPARAAAAAPVSMALSPLESAVSASSLTTAMGLEVKGEAYLAVILGVLVPVIFLVILFIKVRRHARPRATRSPAARTLRATRRVARRLLARRQPARRARGCGRTPLPRRRWRQRVARGSSSVHARPGVAHAPSAAPAAHAHRPAPLARAPLPPPPPPPLGRAPLRSPPPTVERGGHGDVVPLAGPGRRGSLRHHGRAEPLRHQELQVSAAGPTPCATVNTRELTAADGRRRARAALPAAGWPSSSVGRGRAERRAAPR